MKRSLTLVAILAMTCTLSRAEEEKKPTPAPPADAAPVKVDVTKKDQIDAAVDKDVIATGTIASAKWTASGKTLQVFFKDAPEDLRVILYGKNRDALDKAFNGDIATTLPGKQVEITGKLKKYAGSVENWKKFTDLAVTKPEQIKITEEKK